MHGGFGRVHGAWDEGNSLEGASLAIFLPTQHFFTLLTIMIWRNGERVDQDLLMLLLISMDDGQLPLSE